MKVFRRPPKSQNKKRDCTAHNGNDNHTDAGRGGEGRERKIFNCSFQQPQNVNKRERESASDPVHTHLVAYEKTSL